MVANRRSNDTRVVMSGSLGGQKDLGVKQGSDGNKQMQGACNCYSQELTVEAESVPLLRERVALESST